MLCVASDPLDDRWMPCKHPPAVLSKVVHYAVEHSHWVESAIRAHRDELVRRLEGRWRHLVPASAAFPDLATLLDVMAADVAERRATVVGCEERHLAILAENDSYRGPRDQGVAELTRAYYYARDSYESAYERSATKALGFDYLIEENPRRLKRQAQRLIRRLREPWTEPPKPEQKREHVVKPSFLLKVVEPPFLSLSQALDDLRAGELRAQASVQAKKKALAQLKPTVSSVSKMAEMFLRLAGMEEEARRIRFAAFKASQRRKKSPDGNGDETTETPQDEE